ncbi:leucine-rich repeat domain-containing protein [Sutcliffiella horikoshii]|uniref:leucine-rich repeat domain-containing protein n=1 Tax=Sutcliffiella horikoshii TaxID=79883 RepID=UPI003CEC4E9E
MNRSFMRIINVLAVLTLVLSLLSPAIVRAETVSEETAPEASISIESAKKTEEGTLLTIQTETPSADELSNFILVVNDGGDEISPELISEEIGTEVTSRTYTYLDTVEYNTNINLTYVLIASYGEESIMSTPFEFEVENTSDEQSEDNTELKEEYIVFLNILNTSPDAVEFEWSSNAEDEDYYYKLYFNDAYIETEETNQLITDLNPYTEYPIHIELYVKGEKVAESTYPLTTTGNDGTNHLDLWTTQTDRTVTLNWEYLGEGMEKYFEVYKNGEFVDIITQTTKYKVENLEYQSEYEFKVVALENGEELASNTIQVTTASGPTGEVVVFEDANLEIGVKEELGIEDRDIYQSDLLDLEYLEITRKTIASLTGLEKATNLSSLDLGNNDIEDLSPLSNLENLKNLTLYSNNIKDISPLLEMNALEQVDLEYNPIDYYKGSPSYEVILELESKGIFVYHEEFRTYKPIKMEVYEKSDQAIYFNWYYDSTILGNYEVYIDGELIGEIDNHNWSYKLYNLEPETEYTFTLKAIDANGDVLTEGSLIAQTEASPTGDKIIIKDESLTQSIKDQLVINNRDLYQSDLEKLVRLEAQDYGIESLEGIDQARNLEVLYLNENLIKDIAPLSTLESLRHLDLTNNPIQDISSLVEMSGLEGLNLSSTELTNIEPLLELQNLDWVYIINTFSLDKSEDTKTWEVIQTLMDRGVYVDYENYIEYWMDVYLGETTNSSAEVTWVADGNIDASHFNVYLDGDLIDSVQDEYSYMVEGLEPDNEYTIDVEAMDASGNHLHTSTIWVYIQYSSVGTGDPVEFQDENLEDIVRWNLGVHDRDITTGDMEGLTYLHASYADITSLEGLQFAINLEVLDLIYNNITDLSQLAELTSLTNLSIMGNQVSDLSSLSELIDLQYLDADYNNITDLSALKKLQQLETLWLNENPISDLNVLLELSGLQNVYIWDIVAEITEGSDNYEVVNSLINNGVYVDYKGYQMEFSAYEFLITENEIGLEWSTNVSEENIEHFEVIVNGAAPIIIDAESRSYMLKNLSPQTSYFIEVNMITTAGAKLEAFLDITTKQPAENYKEVKFVAVDEETSTGIEGLSYSIQGIESKTANEYHYGYTNADGTLRDYNSASGILSLPIGKYEVILYDNIDFNPGFFEIEITENMDYTVNPIQLDLEKRTLEKVDVTVKVTDNQGNPVTNLEYISLYSNMVVNTFGDEYGYYTDWGLTSEDGVYTLGSLVVGDDYQLSLQSRDYKLHEEFYLNLYEENNTIEVELSAGAKVTGKVLDASGNPLLGASYYAYGNNSYAYGQTKSEGDLTLVGISEEDLELEISMPGYQTKKLTINEEDFNGEQVSLGNITMDPELFIHGKVLDEKGQPVHQASVYLYEGNFKWSTFWTRTDANGYFKVRNVHDDTVYTLKTEAYNQPQTEKEVSASADEYSIILEKPSTGSFVGQGNSISANKQTVTAGAEIEYRINYQNNGEGTAEDVEISFEVPEGISLIEESTLPSEREGSIVNGKVVTIAQVDPAGSGTISFKAKVDPSYDATSFVATANINTGEDQTNLTATTNVNFVTLTAPEATASTTVKIYGAAKAGSEVQIYDGNVLIGTTIAQGRWWYADVPLRTEAGVDSEHVLTAKVKNNNQTAYSSPVTVKYIPTIPTVEDVIIDAGWNQNIKLNPYTGVATFAIVEFTPIDVEIAFDMEIDNGYIHFLGEEYPLEKSGDVYTTNIPDTWSSYGEQMFELEFTVGENTIRLPLMEVIVLIDPSGYVFEGSMDYRLPGVIAEVFERDRFNDQLWKPWNAEFFGQVNPQITDINGRYGWDVLQGHWKVIWTKEGYHTYESRIVEVPPAETELNVPMIRTYDPVLEGITPTDSTQDVALDSSITVEFDRLMKEANIHDFIKVYNTKDNTEVEGTFTLEGYNGYRETAPNSGYFEEDESIKLSKTFVWTPTNNLEAGTEYRVEVSAQLADYNGKVLGATQTSTFHTVAAEEPGDGTEEPGDGTEEPGDGTEEPGNGNEEPGDGNEEPGDGNEEPGDGNEEPGDGTEEPGDETEEPGDSNEQPGTTPGKQPSDKDKTKDKHKADKDVKKEDKKELKGSKLPHTATPLYNYLLLGTFLTIAGATFFLYNRRRNV